jgi:2-methylcitrate dehydratase
MQRSPNQSAAPGVLEALAALVHAVRFEELPKPVIAAAKARVLDTLGCAFGALHSDVGEAVRRMAADCGGSAQATLIGTGEKTSAPLATLVNGSLLRYLDSNDYYFARDPAHPSGNLAVALAVGECHHRSGRDMIAALVAAYEVHLRLCDFAGEPSLWRRGWHHATNAQFASAAAASRLAGDDVTRTAHAMAITGSHQNTLAQLQSGAISMIKGTAEGWVAKAGVEAALLAHHGVTGPLTLIEGAAGWAVTVAGAVDVEALCAPLDGRYRLLETSIKPYPAVATATAPIRAAIELHRAGLPALEAIERIVVRLPAFALNTPSAHAGRRYPAQIESAQHSFYFCTAVALLEGACGEAQFAPAKLAAPALRELLAKVELQEDAEFTALWPQSAGGAVELHMRDGTRRSQRCPYPPGHPRLALTEQELAAKYHDYADPVLTRSGALALREAVNDLDACDDLSEFTPLLVASAAPSTGKISPGEVHVAIDPDAKTSQRAV